ncbi:hypothetical protein CPB83DRAFT_432747 [Crepidotus variabilis]|uniref:Uncharacterized protein n=1 Tax=Crepidotus variabilis TaxID=179855 RepID=A0A9P6EDI8_9AGAR|nr:hypothetical protein CPB83DRAFT_432747 [Crepidotus variabilis]
MITTLTFDDIPILLLTFSTLRNIGLTQSKQLRLKKSKKMAKSLTPGSLLEPERDPMTAFSQFYKGANKSYTGESFKSGVTRNHSASSINSITDSSGSRSNLFGHSPPGIVIPSASPMHSWRGGSMTPYVRRIGVTAHQIGENKMFGTDDAMVLSATGWLTTLQYDRGHWAEAEAAAGEFVKEDKGRPDKWDPKTLFFFAKLYIRQEKWVEVEPVLEELKSRTRLPVGIGQDGCLGEAD